MLSLEKMDRACICWATCCWASMELEITIG